LALVLIEIRHPAPVPLSQSALAVLKDELGDWTPIPEREEMRQFDLQTGENVAVRLHKLVARDRRTAITFRPDAMTVEVTDYPGWDAFRSIVLAMVAARQDVAPVDGCTRIGLRYLNEIRAPLGDDGWSQWVVSSLLGPQDELAEMKLTIHQQQHAVQCVGPHPGDSLTLRYAAAKGAVVQSSPMLQRMKEVGGEDDFFLIDIDSAWADPRNGVPVLDVDLVDTAIERLHEPVRTLFESLITSDLRTKVLERPAQG
jgi:uncharacterized protein (TIGR04255 family)